MTPVLDVACGSRMFWFDKANQLAMFCDNRTESHELCDGRMLHVHPDLRADFTALPFESESFYMVVFDPPHMVRAGPKSWMAKKYGKLGANWQTDMRAGFAECFRVLKPFGTLIFKWNETHIPLSQVLACTAVNPLFGNKQPKQTGTHWLCFMKSPEAA